MWIQISPGKEPSFPNSINHLLNSSIQNSNTPAKHSTKPFFSKHRNTMFALAGWSFQPSPGCGLVSLATFSRLQHDHHLEHHLAAALREPLPSPGAARVRHPAARREQQVEFWQVSFRRLFWGDRVLVEGGSLLRHEKRGALLVPWKKNHLG